MTAIPMKNRSNRFARPRAIGCRSTANTVLAILLLLASTSLGALHHHDASHPGDDSSIVAQGAAESLPGQPSGAEEGACAICDLSRRGDSEFLAVAPALAAPTSAHGPLDLPNIEPRPIPGPDSDRYGPRGPPRFFA